MSFANKPRYNKHSADKQENLTNFLEGIEDDFNTKKLNEEMLIEDIDIDDENEMEIDDVEESDDNNIEDAEEMEEGILDRIIPQLKRGVAKGKNLEQINKYIEQRSGKRTMESIIEGIRKTFNVSDKEAAAYVALYNLEKGAELVPTHGEPDPEDAQARADIAMEKAGKKGGGVLAAGDDEEAIEDDAEEKIDDIEEEKGHYQRQYRKMYEKLDEIRDAINLNKSKEHIRDLLQSIENDLKLNIYKGSEYSEDNTESDEEINEVKEIIKKFQKQYGDKKGKDVYYATASKQSRDPETFKKEEDEEEMEEQEDFSSIFTTRERIIPIVDIINNVINSESAPSAISATPVKRDLANLFFSSVSDSLGIDFGKVGNVQQIIADIADGSLNYSKLEQPEENDENDTEEEPSNKKGTPEAQEKKDMKKQKEVESDENDNENRDEE